MFFFFQAEDGIRDHCVTGVQTCALPICSRRRRALADRGLSACSGGLERGRSGAKQPRSLSGDADGDNLVLFRIQVLHHRSCRGEGDFVLSRTASEDQANAYLLVSYHVCPVLSLTLRDV